MTLTRRYRQPDALAAFADQYRPELGAAATCAELKVVSVRGEAVLERVKQEVAKALRDGAKPSQIAVLSLMGQSKSALFKLSKLGDVKVVRADAADAAQNVVADTFLRFKGLERPYVIVTELDVSPDRYDVRMHVALSRATVGYVVVGTEDEVRRDFRLTSAVTPPAATSAVRIIAADGVVGTRSA